MERKMGHRFNGKPLSFLLSSKGKGLNCGVLSRALKIHFFFLSIFVRLVGFYSFFSFFIFFLILFFFPCVPQGIYLSSIISFVLRAAVCEHALRQRCSDKSGERFAWRCFDMFKVSYSITLGMEGTGAGAENGKAKQEVLPDVVSLRRNMQ